MDLDIQTRPLRAASADAAVLLLAKGEPVPARAASLGGAWRAPAATLVARKLFDGSAGQVQTLLGGPGGRIAALTLVGLGDAAKVTAEGLKRALATGLRAAGEQGARRVAVPAPARLPGRLGAGVLGRALGEAAHLALYRWDLYKKDKPKTAIEGVSLHVGARDGAAARRGLEEGRALGEAVVFARDLGNEPPNVATPRWVAERAQEMARAEGLAYRVLEKEEMERLGMGSLLGVARGSAQPPRLVVLTWSPKGRARVPSIALVGKGITFDTGGISIKPAA
jgi:leucyl aminopeptidase